MAEHENHNNVSPTININAGGAIPQTEGTVLPLLVEFIRQSGLNHQEIKDLISNIESLPANVDFVSLNENLKRSLRASIGNAKSAIIARMEELSTIPANTAEIAKLQESLDRIEKLVDGGFKSATTAEEEVDKLLKDLISRIETLNKRIDDVISRGSEAGNNGAGGNGSDNNGSGDNGAGNDGNGGSGAGGNNGGADNNGNNGAGNDGAGGNGSDNNGSGDNGAGNDGNGDSGAGGNNGGADNNGNNGAGNDGAGGNGSDNNGSGDNGAGNDGNGGSGAGNNGAETNPPSKLKLKKLRYIERSLQQTKILSEARQPWYKRLATFAIKHPVLSVVAGAGLGLALFGVTCGISAIAGGTGFLTAVNMLIPSLPGIVGIGALGGGAFSLVSNTMPKGQLGLYAKASKLFGKVKKIDKKKQWYASVEKQQETAKKLSRERHKNSKGLVRKLKVHKKVAKVHKLAERTSRKLSRLYGRKLVSTTSKALESKNKLNAKELKSNKTQALAGYLQKKRKAESKFAEGKISKEEFDETISDLDEDYSDLDGGSEGLSEVGDQYTFDSEALEAIKVADASGENSVFQSIKEEIETRNSVETRSIATKVVLDPEYLAKVIEEQKKKGNLDRVQQLSEMRESILESAHASEEMARAEGIDDFEALVDLTDEERAQWDEEHNL